MALHDIHTGAEFAVYRKANLKHGSMEALNINHLAGSLPDKMTSQGEGKGHC